MALSSSCHCIIAELLGLQLIVALKPSLLLSECKLGITTGRPTEPAVTAAMRKLSQPFFAANMRDADIPQSVKTGKIKDVLVGGAAGGGGH